MDFLGPCTTPYRLLVSAFQAVAAFELIIELVDQVKEVVMLGGLRDPSHLRAGPVSVDPKDLHMQASTRCEGIDACHIHCLY